MPTAVHFGAGLIGRGYIAERFHESGYEVVFVDVVDDLIESLQKTPKYTVTAISAEGEAPPEEITNYRAINSKNEPQKVVEEIASADSVTCAVGPNILKFIAPVIADGINARTKDYPLAVIACENAINATTTLSEFIKPKLSEETVSSLDKKVRYANSAIDRIVPAQAPNSGLNVRIEKFYEWCVELPPFKGMQEPKVKGIHYVDDLTPYIERKLFTVNTGHAVTAYFGFQKLGPKGLIYQCLDDDDIKSKVKAALSETANLIIKKHGIAKEEQQKYVDTIIARFENRSLEDPVERVGRQPIRKLSRKERFIGPAAQLAEMGESCDALLAAIEMALRFQNVDGDPESVELAKILKEQSAKDATAKLTGLEESHPLFDRVQKVVAKVQGN
jgi:mannitol-1-phosphate 5-dehydrogenase